MEHFVGGSIELVATFSVDGTLTDPSTISLSIMDPAGAVTTYTYGAAQITKDSTGVFSKNISLTTEGNWKWRWVGTGTVVAAEEGEVYVKPSEFV